MNMYHRIIRLSDSLQSIQGRHWELCYIFISRQRGAGKVEERSLNENKWWHHFEKWNVQLNAALTRVRIQAFPSQRVRCWGMDNKPGKGCKLHRLGHRFRCTEYTIVDVKGKWLLYWSVDAKKQEIKYTQQKIDYLPRGMAGIQSIPLQAQERKSHIRRRGHTERTRARGLHRLDRCMEGSYIHKT